MSNLHAAAQALREKTNAQNNPNTIGNSANVYQPQTQGSRNATMQIFQSALKTKRAAKCITQRELALKAGMSQGTVTRAEVHGWVSIWTMLRLLDALDAKITIT